MLHNQPKILKLDNDKLDYIVHLISSTITINREMETLISNFIDYTCEKKLAEAEKCKLLIKEKQPHNYNIIIYAANSIIYNYDLAVI